MDFRGLKIKTQPAQEPVTLVEAKAWCEIATADTRFDTMLQSLIKSCREAVEKQCHRAIINTVYQVSFDCFPAVIELPRPPLVSVDSIIYIDTAGEQQTFDSDNYRVDSMSSPARITPAYGVSWPVTREVTNAVIVEYTAGYGTAPENVPETIRICIRSMVADLFAHRESEMEINLYANKHIQRLINSNKLIVL